MILIAVFCCFCGGGGGFYSARRRYMKAEQNDKPKQSFFKKSKIKEEKTSQNQNGTMTSGAYFLPASPQVSGMQTPIMVVDGQSARRANVFTNANGDAYHLTVPNSQFAFTRVENPPAYSPTLGYKRRKYSRSCEDLLNTQKPSPRRVFRQRSNSIDQIFPRHYNTHLT